MVLAGSLRISGLGPVVGAVGVLVGRARFVAVGRGRGSVDRTRGTPEVGWLVGVRVPAVLP